MDAEHDGIECQTPHRDAKRRQTASPISTFITATQKPAISVNMEATATLLLRRQLVLLVLVLVLVPAAQRNAH